MFLLQSPWRRLAAEEERRDFRPALKPSLLPPVFRPVWMSPPDRLPFLLESAEDRVVAWWSAGVRHVNFSMHRAPKSEALD